MGYKRFMAIGCSHGSLVDPKAVEAVLKFRDRFKPHTKIHLGDICDYAAFRSGAIGTKDEAAEIGPDILAGARLIRDFAPTDVLIGNHDERVWKLANHQNAIVAHAASMCRNEFLTACNKAKVKRIVDHYDIRKSWIQLGNYKVLHGFMYSVNALTEHADTFGNCIIAHLHTPGMARGRRVDHPTAFCIGFLGAADKFDYAARRRATLRWSLAFAWGEYSDTDCIVNISQCENGKAGQWRLPL